VKKNNEILEKFIWQYKVVEYLSYFSVFFIPLYFSSKYIFPTNIPKIIAIMAIVILMAFFYLWGSWYRKIQFKFSIVGLSLFLFLISLTISSIYGTDPINSFFGWRNVIPLMAIYAISLFAFIVGDLIKNDKKICIKLLLSSFLTSILVLIIFYFNTSSVLLQDGSTLGNSSYLGTYLLFNFLFGIGLFFYYKNLWQKILIILGSLFLIINPLFINKDFLLFKISLSDVFSNPLSILGIANGATMGVGIAILSTIFLLFIFSKKKILKIIGIVSMILFVFSIFWTGKELVTSGTHLNQVFTETKTGNRFLAWNIAQREFSDNPVLGNGYNNYIYSFDKYYNQDMYSDGYMVERFFKPHNVFWEFASETGVFGLFSYLILLLILFFTLINIKRGEEESFNNLRIVLASLLIGYFVQNLFMFDTISSYLLLFVIISIGLGFANGYEIKISDKFKILQRIFIVILLFACVVSIYLFAIAPSLEAKMIKNVTPVENITENFVHDRKGIQEVSLFCGVMDNTYLFSNLLDYYQKKLYKVDENNKSFYLNELESMISSLENDMLSQPYYSESYLTISQIYNLYLMAEMKTGKDVRFNGINYNKIIWDKSYNAIMKSMELNPNNPQAYLTLSQLYMLKADFKNAYLYNKITIEMAPKYEKAHIMARNLLKIFPNKEFEAFLVKALPF